MAAVTACDMAPLTMYLNSSALGQASNCNYWLRFRKLSKNSWSLIYHRVILAFSL